MQGFKFIHVSNKGPSATFIRQNRVSVGSDNGLSPIQHQAII